ncbi:MAG: hypothetical protein CBB87_07175 [Micavibrio sp. TMED27]|nr:polysaccharide synthesis protein exod [Micavibrio sp.]OUT90904.1 MAG: hypothetical protein CBB87_07175 [Micavibrio sp. TMED27]|tara:strand:- start:311 stop:925 length:615 start_codon:yes stop_codon:yes gene_type:complete
MRTLSQTLSDLAETFDGERTSIGELLITLHERGIGLLLFIFALPAAIPLPGLGVNLIIALPLLLLTAQQLLARRSVWMPQAVLKRGFKTKSLKEIIAKSIPYVEKLEYLSRPRLAPLTSHGFSPLIGFAGLIMSLSICIPLPLTNTVPAMGIAIMAMGVIMRDGLAVMCGMTLGLVWVGIISAALLFFGLEGLVLVKDTIRSFI